jgi:hypothetical protein
VFDDLDDTLRALLDDGEAPAALREADVSVQTPDRDFRPPLPTVNLFLHEVKENRTLRDPEPLRVLADGQYARRQSPLRIDCSYLVTTWSPQDAALKVAEEHRLLGQTLAWLARFGTLPERFCRGQLRGQPYPPPTVVAQLDGGRTTSEFWDALGIAPRPAFTLTVTVALELGVVEPDGPRVETTVLRITAPAGGSPPG